MCCRKMTLRAIQVILHRRNTAALNGGILVVAIPGKISGVADQRHKNLERRTAVRRQKFLRVSAGDVIQQALNLASRSVEFLGETDGSLP